MVVIPAYSSVHTKNKMYIDHIYRDKEKGKEVEEEKEEKNEEKERRRRSTFTITCQIDS